MKTSTVFIRDGADTVVVIVSDELDCSYNNEHETIWLPSGDRTFWSNPDEGAPTSAVCWNAGVACVGSSPYDGCGSEDYDLDANPDAADDDAVMRPVSRYEDTLDDLDMANGSGVVRVALIGGVPDNGGDLVYADSPNAQEQEDWGIGWGCDSGSVTGLPPVRMRELFQNATPAGECPLYSICSDAYCDELEHIIDGVVP